MTRAPHERPLRTCSLSSTPSIFFSEIAALAACTQDAARSSHCERSVCKAPLTSLECRRERSRLRTSHAVRSHNGTINSAAPDRLVERGRVDDVEQRPQLPVVLLARTVQRSTQRREQQRLPHTLSRFMSISE